MSMIECIECKKEISDTAKACPHCGAKVPKTKWWLWGPLGFIVFVLFIGGVSSNTPEGKEKSHARDVISTCWSDYERKSFDPQTKLFIASTCEKLEGDFLKKYGLKP